jgi:hypothetical protein
MSSPEKPNTNSMEAAAQIKGINSSKETISKRLEYSQALDFILELAREKITNKWTKCPDRLAYARIVIAACSSGNDILRDSELEQLSLRLDEVEKEMKKNARP